MAMKKVLITGAGGAIGAHVVQYLLEKPTGTLRLRIHFLMEHKGFFDRLSEATRKMRGEQFIGMRVKTIVHDLRAPFTDREVIDIGPIHYVINSGLSFRRPQLHLGPR